MHTRQHLGITKETDQGQRTIGRKETARDYAETRAGPALHGTRRAGTRERCKLARARFLRSAMPVLISSTSPLSQAYRRLNAFLARARRWRTAPSFRLSS